MQDDNTFKVYQAAIDSMDYISSIKNSRLVSQDLKAMVFPNPSHGTTYIKFNQPVYRDCRLAVYNTMGSLVYSVKVNEGSELISFEAGDFRQGLYIIRIESSTEVIDTRKLIISQ